MPTFQVAYIDKHTTRLRRVTVDAIDAGQARDMVALRGALVGEVQASGVRRYRPDRVKVRNKDLLVALDSLGLLLGTGVVIDQALRAIVEKLPPGPLRFIFTTLTNDVEAGRGMAHSLRNFPQVFPEAAMGLAQAYEQVGQLEKGMAEIADYLASVEEIKGQVAQGILMPGLGLITGLSVVTFIFLSPVPKFKVLLLDLSSMDQMPFVTRTVFGLSDFLHNHWLALVIALFGGLVSLWRISQSRAVRRRVARWACKVPVLGPALVSASLARFCKTYVALSRVGYTVVDILAVGSRSVGNSYIEDALDSVRLRITQANDALPEAFRAQSRVFPPDFITATSTAPDNLPEIFHKLGIFYAREAKNSMTSAVALLNPIITFFLGFVVALVGIALFWPIISLLNQGPK